MKHRLSRRSFFKTSLLASAAAGALSPAPFRARAAEPFKHSSTPRLKLGLAAYSFRLYFEHGEKNGGLASPSGKPIDMFEFIDYCAEHGCDGAELTSYYFPAQLDDAYLLRLKRHAFLRGVEISGSAIGNVFTHPKGERRNTEIAAARRWIDRAALLGAPHIRIFAGEAPKGVSIEDARKNCIETTEEVAAYAGEKGVFLGIENHGGIVAEASGLLNIIKAINSPWVGINLDTGNFRTENPQADLALCAPYAVNVQFKTDISPKAKPTEEANVHELLGILRKANYQGYVTLEYEHSENPWTGVPKWLGRLREEIARA